MILDLYERVNDLVVMDILSIRNRKHYSLVCSLGHSVNVRSDSLKPSRVCRTCYNKSKKLSYLKRVPSILQGDTKGQLKVLEVLPNKPYEKAKVLTICTCGNKQEMFACNFTKNTQSWSCGNCVPYHKYVGDTLILYCTVGSDDLEIIIDKEDNLLLLENFWGIHRDAFNNYVRFSTEGRTFLHRVITNCPDDMFVDHINGNGLDNRKCNLRVVGKRENSRNTKRNKNSSSGKMGVYYREDSGKWRAFINGESGRINLGTFPTREEAIKVREDAESFYGYHENHGRVT